MHTPDDANGQAMGAAPQAASVEPAEEEQTVPEHEGLGIGDADEADVSHDGTVDAVADSGFAQAAAALAAPIGSGLYTRAVTGAPGKREELRVDVDGRWAQKMVSGYVPGQWHWVARLEPHGQNRWVGPIFLRHAPGVSFPWTRVVVQVTPSSFPEQQRVRLEMRRPGGKPRVRSFAWASPSFRKINFEFDWEEGEAPTLSVNTCAHPNRPSLTCQNLTIEEVFRRAGFDVTTSPGGPVPKAKAGIDRRWTAREMHDAMQAFWSRFAGRPQWAVWIFFASLYKEDDPHYPDGSTAGLMFDDIGREQRQGTAVFNDSFIAQAPAGDPSPAAYVQREKFYTAVHEMGHTLNLAHSFQKELTQEYPELGSSWIPLRDEPEARSFMNYPQYVRGGAKAFFGTFRYGFSGQDLRFLRHAHLRHVQPGRAPFFDHHGFAPLEASDEPPLDLRVRVNRDRHLFEFMEPVTLELKLTNRSDEPRIVDEQLLRTAHGRTVVIRRDRGEARELLPYGQRCLKPAKRVLAPGESIYAPLFAAAGRNGWDLAEPGHYTVQVGLRVGGENVVSNALRIRVAPPRSYEEEFLAQDFFSQDVGRILAFNGSTVLERGNDVLHEVRAQLADRRVARHAELALGQSLGRDLKRLEPDEGGERAFRIGVDPARPEGRELLSSALLDDAAAAVETFGHIGFKLLVDGYSELLEADGEPESAADAQDGLYETLSKREVQGSRVPEGVLREIDERRGRYRG